MITESEITKRDARVFASMKRLGWTYERFTDFEQLAEGVGIRFIRDTDGERLPIDLAMLIYAYTRGEKKPGLRGIVKEIRARFPVAKDGAK